MMTTAPVVRSFRVPSARRCDSASSSSTKASRTRTRRSITTRLLPRLRRSTSAAAAEERTQDEAGAEGYGCAGERMLLDGAFDARDGLLAGLHRAFAGALGAGEELLRFLLELLVGRGCGFLSRAGRLLGGRTAVLGQFAHVGLQLGEFLLQGAQFTFQVGLCHDRAPPPYQGSSSSSRTGPRTRTGCRARCGSCVRPASHGAS